MVDGGVNATGRRDEFTCHFHAQEHFAPGFVIVAGCFEDIFDVAGVGLFAEEVQDGLTMG